MALSGNPDAFTGQLNEQRTYLRRSRVWNAALVAVLKSSTIVVPILIAAATGAEATAFGELQPIIPYLAVWVAIAAALDTWLKPLPRYNSYRDAGRDLDTIIRDFGMYPAQYKTYSKQFADLREALDARVRDS